MQDGDPSIGFRLNVHDISSIHVVYLSDELLDPLSLRTRALLQS